MKNITPFVWLESRAEEAAKFYVSVFKKAKIVDMKKLDEEGAKISGQRAGSLSTISVKMGNMTLTLLNGGKFPGFEITSAFSFTVPCENQKEIDFIWEKLKEGGKEMQCGWIVDKYGLTWQVIPYNLDKFIYHKNPEKAKKALAVMYSTVKFDIKKLEESCK
ncbi:MAG TPA: VOC family protein [Candidatus Nanoarchaeia archaeon]|nr:VOC family protein [Candidatus Nanoarchaeia archaeon]